MHGVTVAPRTITADELLQMPDDSYRYALVDGELRRMTPAGFRHGALVVRVMVPLAVHVKAHALGIVCGAETGFVLRRNPDTVLAPRCRIRPARADSGVRRAHNLLGRGARPGGGGSISRGHPPGGRREGGGLALRRHARCLGGELQEHVDHDSRARPDTAPAHRKEHAGRRAAAARLPPAGRRHFQAIAGRTSDLDNRGGKPRRTRPGRDFAPANQPMADDAATALFFELFSGLPRQGPGDTASTLRASSQSQLTQARGSV